MGLLDRTTVRLTLLEGEDEIAPPPHMTWEADFGIKRLPELKEGCQDLLLRTIGMKEEFQPDDETLSAMLQARLRISGEVDEYLRGRGVPLMMKLAHFTGMTFEGLSRSAERFPSDDPFVGLDLDALVSAPGYLRGRPEGFAWPLVFGLVCAEVERELGWRRPPEKVDRRTWAALIGWCYYWTKANAQQPAPDDANPPALSPEDLKAAELAGVGRWLVITQRSALLGYAGAR